MEDQAVEIVGDVGQSEFGLCAGEADRADEETEPVLLMIKDMLDPGPDRRRGGVGPGDIPRHCLAARLAPMNTADQHLRGEPCLVLPRPAALSAQTSDSVLSVLTSRGSIRPSGWNAGVTARARMKPNLRSITMSDL